MPPSPSSTLLPSVPPNIPGRVKTVSADQAHSGLRRRLYRWRKPVAVGVEPAQPLQFDRPGYQYPAVPRCWSQRPQPPCKRQQPQDPGQKLNSTCQEVNTGTTREYRGVQIGALERPWPPTNARCCRPARTPGGVHKRAAHGHHSPFAVGLPPFQGMPSARIRQR